MSFWSFPGGASGKEPACRCRRHKRSGFDPWVGKIPWRKKWQSTLIFLPGTSHGQRSLVGCSPKGPKSQTEATSHTHTHTHTRVWWHPHQETSAFIPPRKWNIPATFDHIQSLHLLIPEWTCEGLVIATHLPRWLAVLNGNSSLSPSLPLSPSHSGAVRVVLLSQLLASQK